MAVAADRPFADGEPEPRRSAWESLERRMAVPRARYTSGATRSSIWRLRQLEGLRALCVEREAEITAALRADLGKPAVEAYASEIAFVRDEAAAAHRALAGWMRPERVRPGLLGLPGRAEVVPEPLGTVLIIAPWNDPLQLALMPLIGAVAAGNTAVLKPSELAPATSAFLARRVPEYLDPSGVLVLEGGVQEAQAILSHRFDHIFFTGSARVGREVMRAAAEHLTPVTLELGGKSPCIVDRSADLGTAARRIVWGKFFNAGQTCVAPDYLLVHEAVAEALTARISEAILHFYGEHPIRSPDFGRVVNERHFDRLVGLLESGGVVAVGGETARAERYIAPTVLREVTADAPIMQEEIFGPLLPVLTYTDTDEAIAFVNARPKPLALYVFARDALPADRILERTSSGGAVVNHVLLHLSVRDLPFGGVGDSGMGRYHGRASFDTFSHRKSVLRKPTRYDLDLMYPPYTARKQAWLKRLL